MRSLLKRRSIGKYHNITGQSFPLFARREKFLTPTVWAFFPHPDGSATWISNTFDTFEIWSRNSNIWFSFVNEYVFWKWACFLENGYVFLENGYVFLENGYVFLENGYVFLENGYVFFGKWVCFFYKINMFFFSEMILLFFFF